MDILMGSVSTAAQTAEYKDLQISNIENQIYNRNRSENRQQAKAAKEDDEEDEVGDSTRNVIQGVTTIDDLSSAEKEKVKTDLRELGFYEEEAPEWYIEMENANAGQTVVPEVIKESWEEYRQGIIGGGI